MLMRTSPLTDRIGAACGAAYVVLITVGNAIAVSGQSNTPTGTQVLQYADETAASTVRQIGMAMEVLGFVAFAFFLAWLVPALRSAAGRAPWLADVVLIGGLGTLAVKIGSIAPEVAVDAGRKTMDPDLAKALYDIAAGAFVISFLPFAILMLGLGASVLSSGYLGRFAGWSAVVLGVLGLAVVVTADSVDANPMPFMLGLLWILVVSVRLAWKGARRAESTTSSDEPIAALA
jgi:hypothetical protein